jgi:hypothetical protein
MKKGKSKTAENGKANEARNQRSEDRQMKILYVVTKKGIMKRLMENRP